MNEYYFSGGGTDTGAMRQPNIVEEEVEEQEAEMHEEEEPEQWEEPEQEEEETAKEGGISPGLHPI